MFRVRGSLPWVLLGWTDKDKGGEIKVKQLHIKIAS